MDCLAKFQADYDSEYKIIEADPILTPMNKQAFREALSNCDDSTTVEECAENYFHGKKQIGPSIAFPRERELLGRIQSYSAFAKLLMREARLAKEDVDELLASLKGIDPSDRLDEIKSALGAFQISPYLIWAFRNPESPDNPLSGQNLAELPCRLGLDTVSIGADVKYVGWGLSIANNASVTQPTAFDPGLEHLSRWKFGGLTTPNPDCTENYDKGLPEMVVSPICFDRVASDFVEFYRK